MQRLNNKLWFQLKKQLQLPTQFGFRSRLIKQLEIEIVYQLWDQLREEEALGERRTLQKAFVESLLNFTGEIWDCSTRPLREKLLLQTKEEALDG